MSRTRFDMSGGALRAVVFLFVFSLILTGASLVFTAREVNASRANAASIVQLCQAGNASRAQQVTLWEHVLTVAAAGAHPRETPAQRRARLATSRAFDAYLRKVFAPRDCTAIAR